MKRILGVDFGVARTGVAVTDPLGMMAQGVATISSRRVEKVLEEVVRYAREYDVEAIVVGLPKNMNNTIGERGEACMEFGDMLKAETGLEVVMWDERCTTVSAHTALNFNNTKGKKRKAVVDAVAAVIILEDYLQYRKNNKYPQ